MFEILCKNLAKKLHFVNFYSSKICEKVPYANFSFSSVNLHIFCEFLP